MHSKTLITATLVGLAAARIQRVEVVKREIQVLQERQTGDDELDACLTAMAEVLTDIPTGPSALTSWMIEQGGNFDACDFTVPAVIADEWEEYQSSVLEWWSSVSDSWESALSQCPAYIVASATDAVDVPECTDAATDDDDTTAVDTPTRTRGSSGKPTAAADEEDEEEDTKDDSNDDEDDGNDDEDDGKGKSSGSKGGKKDDEDDEKENAASRSTGLAGLAVAFAAFIGAVAMI
ncbi:hypothetical protein VTJ04DRAFT_5063 [Mycothermus thermophilus]|uniref:uncharacterized protein n=1 Tax=Humicola insolens TaxID=85995 RepID=UPI00374471A6